MSTLHELTDILVSLAVGLLIAFFMSAVIILILACKRNKQYYNTYFKEGNEAEENKEGENEDDNNSQPVVSTFSEVIRNREKTVMENVYESILSDDQWMDDVSGLMPHCLIILKQCRSLTERLTSLTMGVFNTKGKDGLKQVVDCARRISSCVDDMVSSMYPPLNPYVLESRATALILAVTQLAVITQYECRNKKIPMDWINKSIAEMEEHVRVLRITRNEFRMVPSILTQQRSSTSTVIIS